MARKKYPKLKQVIRKVNDLKNIEVPNIRDIYEVKVHNTKNGTRYVGFKYTGKEGFGKWKVKYNEKKSRVK